MIDRRQFVPLVAGALAMGAAGLPSAHAQDVPELLAEAWGYTGGASGGTGTPAIDARLFDLFVYVRYLELFLDLQQAPVDAGDCALGATLTPRQQAVDALAATSTGSAIGG